MLMLMSPGKLAGGRGVGGESSPCKEVARSRCTPGRLTESQQHTIRDQGGTNRGPDAQTRDMSSGLWKRCGIRTGCGMRRGHPETSSPIPPTCVTFLLHCCALTAKNIHWGLRDIHDLLCLCLSGQQHLTLRSPLPCGPLAWKAALPPPNPSSPPLQANIPQTPQQARPQVLSLGAARTFLPHDDLPGR